MTKVLNQAVKRNADRFPADFAFRIETLEWRLLMAQAGDAEANRSQFVTGSQKHRDPRVLPRAFTEHGAIMAATVLNSPRAVQMSVFVVRAFVGMRAVLSETRELARKLAALEREVKARLDGHDAAIVEILQRFMEVIDPPERPEPPRKRIGFAVEEPRAAYRTGAGRGRHRKSDANSLP